MQIDSKVDKSVNFVEEQLEGFLESRYVRKVDDYFICYLSSQSGCNKGCLFCHLTTTGQKSFKDCDYQDFLNQALQVFRHYRNSKQPAKYMHYNFMARGEVLSNKYIIKDADSILYSLANLAVKDGLNPKFNVSTIMPTSLKVGLTDIFKIITPTIYYSLYNIDNEWRKKWMPAAMPVDNALKLLSDYQKMTKKIVKIHFPFIKNENDSIENLEKMFDLIESYNLWTEFNLVRYNTYSEVQGEESSEDVIERNLKYIESRIKGKVQMIPRVGPDCKASCGMFVDK